MLNSHLRLLICSLFFCLLGLTPIFGQLSIGVHAGIHIPNLRTTPRLTPELLNSSSVQYARLTTSYATGQQWRIDCSYRVGQMMFGVAYSEFMDGEQLLAEVAPAAATVNFTTQRVEPYLQLQVKLKPKLSLAFQLGGIAAFNTSTTFQQTYTLDDPTTYFVKAEHRAPDQWSYGAWGGLGLAYQLAPRLELMLSAKGVHHTALPTEAEVLEFTADGIDRLDALASYERQIEYVPILRRLDVEEGLPRERLSFSQSFSSMGLEASVRFYLGKLKD